MFKEWPFVDAEWPSQVETERNAPHGVTCDVFGHHPRMGQILESLVMDINGFRPKMSPSDGVCRLNSTACGAGGLPWDEADANRHVSSLESEF